MTQTAVDYLVKKFHDYGTLYYSDITEAKEMEKAQIIDADLNATIRTAKGANSDVSVRRVKELAEHYYNEKYNK